METTNIWHLLLPCNYSGILHSAFFLRFAYFYLHECACECVYSLTQHETGTWAYQKRVWDPLIQELGVVVRHLRYRDLNLGPLDEQQAVLNLRTSPDAACAL